MERDISKALEIWTLQNLLDVSIMLGILAAGLALAQGYYRSLEQRLSLRVSMELWQVITVILVDVLLAIVALIGYLVLNTDIMADIKIALPFCPIATILFTVALVLRLFHGGHRVASGNYMRSLYFMFAANLVNMIGFSCIMEAPSGEYLEQHPSPFWQYVKTQFRSDMNLELSQITFYILFPILLAVLVWGAASALRQIKAMKGASDEVAVENR